MADKKAIGELWAQALEKRAPAARAQRLSMTGGDAKSIFCKDWPTAKSVLQALQAVVPQPGPIIIGLVIAAGDAAYQRLCGK
ncbi:MAG TPA: hypothetical protein VIM02_11920 [Rhizomicrobium sp.]|jgi:hypothetical protein